MPLNDLMSYINPQGSPRVGVDPYLDEIMRQRQQLPAPLSPDQLQDMDLYSAASQAPDMGQAPPTRELRLQTPVETGAHGMLIRQPLNLSPEEMDILRSRIEAEQAVKGEGSIRYQDPGSDEWKTFQPTGPRRVTVTPEMRQSAQAEADRIRAEQEDAARQEAMLAEIERQRQHELSKIRTSREPTEVDRQKLALAQRGQEFQERSYTEAQSAESEERARMRQREDATMAERKEDKARMMADQEQARKNETFQQFIELSNQMKESDPVTAARLAQIGTDGLMKSAFDIVSDALPSGAAPLSIDVSTPILKEAEKKRQENFRSSIKTDPGLRSALADVKAAYNTWLTTPDPDQIREATIRFHSAATAAGYPVDAPEISQALDEILREPPGLIRILVRSAAQTGKPRFTYEGRTDAPNYGAKSGYPTRREGDAD